MPGIRLARREILYREQPTWPFLSAAALMALGLWLHLTERREHWHEHELLEHSHARLAALLGDTAAAVRSYNHFLALRTSPEPRLVPEVRRIRAEVQRLAPKN